MKGRHIFLLLPLLVGALAATRQQTVDKELPFNSCGGLGRPVIAAELAQFTWVDIYIDAGATPLAVYQLELGAAAGQFEIVGVEGGEHPAFVEPPYYDPAALSQARVILAAFSLAEELPAGPTRVARVHVMIPVGSTPQFTISSLITADADGTPMVAAARVVEGGQP
ncbi:MAG: hypothetical protein AB1716_01375 [Planctomycetota bacterium]